MHTDKAAADMFQSLVQQLSRKLGVDINSAASMLKRWQTNQKQMRKQLEQHERDKASGKQKLRPIWTCAVCGRANLPHVACWVAPYIVRYEPV